MPLNLAYSFSRISDYECKRRFAKKYIEKRPEPTTVIAIIGKVAHEILSFYISRLYDKHQTKDIEALEKLTNKVIADKTRRGQWPSEFSKKDILNVEVSVRALFEDINLEINPNVREFHVERKLVFDDSWLALSDSAWFEKHGIYFRSILDWAYIPENENTLWIIDHKTGWGEPDEKQLRYYALTGFAGISHDVERVGIKFHWVAQNGRMEDKGFFSPSEILEIRTEVNEKIKEIEYNTDWDTPTPGKYCDNCGFIKDCPAANEAVALVKSDGEFSITNKPDAEKAFEMFLLASIRLKELEKLLKKYVEDHGPVTAAGKIMESRPQTSWKLEDPYGLQAELIKLGIHPTDIMKSTGITKTNLNKLLKDNDLIRHQESLKKKYGKEDKKDGEIKAYVLKGEK